MNIFLLVDNYEDCVIGIIKTEMDYNDFGKELLKTKIAVQEAEEQDYDDYYTEVFSIMWENGLDFEIEYIDKKIYI